MRRGNIKANLKTDALPSGVSGWQLTIFIAQERLLAIDVIVAMARGAVR